MNDEALREKIDKILMEAEGKYFSSQYDDQATEAIRWPTRDQLLHLIAEDRERVERELIEYYKSQALHGDFRSSKLSVHGQFVPLAVIEYRQDLAASLTNLNRRESDAKSL